jgi:putative chitinase
MSAITHAQLRALMRDADTRARAGYWLAALNDCMRTCAITTPARQAAFLAQVMVASSELRHIEESLDYAPQRLRQIWPQRFPNDAMAAHYGHHPARLANHLYAHRMGNGAEASGDGWRFHGRGLIQLTGRAHYQAFAHATQTDALAHPELLQEPPGAALSAGWFWQAQGFNALADQLDGQEAGQHFATITRHIHGVTLGLDACHAYWHRARAVLAGAA